MSASADAAFLSCLSVGESVVGVLVPVVMDASAPAVSGLLGVDGCASIVWEQMEDVGVEARCSSSSAGTAAEVCSWVRSSEMELCRLAAS